MLNEKKLIKCLFRHFRKEEVKVQKVQCKQKLREFVFSDPFFCVFSKNLFGLKTVELIPKLSRSHVNNL
jgi:hypothetical protein